MHVGCLGATGYCLGSVLFELVFENCIDKSPANSLDALWEMMRDEYSKRKTKHRLTALSFSMFFGPRPVAGSDLQSRGE